VPRYIVGETPDMCPPWVAPPGRLLQESRSATIIYHDRCEEARWKLASLLPPGFPEQFRPLVSECWSGCKEVHNALSMPIATASAVRMGGRPVSSTDGTNSRMNPYTP
jgi:hypothetical protein